MILQATVMLNELSSNRVRTDAVAALRRMANDIERNGFPKGTVRHKVNDKLVAVMRLSLEYGDETNPDARVQGAYDKFDS